MDLGTGRPADTTAGWTWPPAASAETPDGERFRTEQWAPPSAVRRPWVRMGRWVVLYRRGA